MKVLVTGAGGMVGRALLADPGAAAHDILAPGRGDLDLLRADACAAFVARERPELIVHLAAVVGGIQANLDAPVRFLADNLTLGVNLLRAAREARTPRLINLGSSCMYPRDAADPLAEAALLSGPLEATNEGYALAKLAAWKLVQAATREDPALVWRTLIPPNLYGPFDHFEPARSHLLAAAIAKIADAVRDGRREVTIWGDGAARREFLYAADLAEFIWRWCERLEALPETMNVGVGEDLCVDDYYRTVAEVLRYDGGFVHDLARPVGMRRKRLGVSAQSRLGWRPRTDLRDGIAVAAAGYLAG